MATPKMDIKKKVSWYEKWHKQRELGEFIEDESDKLG